MSRKYKIFVDTKPIMGRKVDFDLNILQDLHQDLTDYLKMPIEEVSRNYWSMRDGQDKQKQRLIENATCEEKVIEYYRTTGQYLYELSLWEAQEDKQKEFKKIYLFCKKFNIKKVLDFGGGVGGLSIYLNKQGLQCDYLDIPGQTYNFAKWRFNRYKIELKIIDAWEDLLPSCYGAVVTYDVFEHIFDLEGAIKKINECLISDGYLLGISTFSGGGLHLLKNEIYLDFKNFDDLLIKNGFKFFGQLKVDYLSSLFNKIGFKYLVLSIRLRRRLKHGGSLIVHRKISDSLRQT